DDVVQVDAFDTLNLAASVSSIAGATLRKRGLGTLNLAADNTTMASNVTVAEGSLGVLHNNALSTGTIPNITVSARPSIAAAGNLTGVAANITSLNGTGPNGTGALRNLAGNNTWAGNITLGANSTALVFAGTLTINGNLSNNTLTKIGTGDLTLGGANANSS